MKTTNHHLKAIKAFKGRLVNVDKQVRVYRNTGNQSKCRWSVVQRGLVVGHADHLYLGRCKFVVSQAGRLRVIKEGRKNVHAYVSGKLIDDMGAWGVNLIYLVEGHKFTNCKVRYNPYTMDSFQYASGKPIKACDAAYLSTDIKITFGD